MLLFRRISLIPRKLDDRHDLKPRIGWAQPMAVRSFILTLFLSFILAACQNSTSPEQPDSPPESPVEALHKIIRLYEAGNFESLIREHLAQS